MNEWKRFFLPFIYKLKKELVEQFAEACEKEGISQARQLTKMMTEFVEKSAKK